MPRKTRITVLAAAAVVAFASRPAFAQSAANDGDVTAIKQVIQQSNHEQEQAIASRDASSMKDTSTAEYYQQQQQTARQLLDSGVTSATLNGIEWGPVTVNGPTATAVAFETWTAVFSDSSAQESRDENDYALVRQDGRWLIWSDDHPGGVADPLSRRVQPRASRTPTPIPSNTVPPTASSRSSNWSGYASTAGTFTTVSGTWTIPAFNPDSGPGMSAPWVGIGGTNTQDLIQAGTEQQSSGSGQSEYSAWVETLPDTSQSVPLVVRAGDSITVTLKETSPNQWHITLTNNTTGKSYETDRQYQSSHSSAEWIQEAPTGFAGVLPIDDFGAVTFTGSSATLNGQQVHLSQTDAQAITLENADGAPLVVISEVGSDGQSFTATRTPALDSLPGERRAAPGGASLP